MIAGAFDRQAFSRNSLHGRALALKLRLEDALPRRPCCKRVEEMPGVNYFKPRAVPMSALEEVTLSVEELEALRLAHLEGLYQQDAAERMGVSRATFGRVLDAAHRTVTRALVEGCALRIEGGSFRLIGPERCERCPAKADLVAGEPSPCLECPVKDSPGGNQP
jgi:predicted DNA-binding protein (UPF0251 family)